MSETEAVGTDAGAACSCKVGRNAERYGLDGLDARIGERHVDGDSLRDLEAYVNTRILEGALRTAGADVIGDVGAIYGTLTGDDVSAGERTEVRERLSNAGVDVESMEDDFVSYQTVRTHLRECLDVDTDRERRLSVPDARGTIEWARSRSEGIVERTLDRLAGSGAVTAGDLDATHVIRVSCRDCDATYPVDEFVDRGGCDCGDAHGTDGHGNGKHGGPDLR